MGTGVAAPSPTSAVTHGSQRKALDLGLPTVIEASGRRWTNTARRALKVRYEFAARGAQPPVVMHWYSGAERPKVLGTPDLPGGAEDPACRIQGTAPRGPWTPHSLLPEATLRTPFPAADDSDSIRAPRGVDRRVQGDREDGFSADLHGHLTEIGALGNVAYRTGKR